MKLVRDRIDAIPWTEDPDEVARLRAEHLCWVAPDSPEYRELLRLKLFEEAGELADADRRGDPGEVLDEAADVLEVLQAMLVAAGVSDAVTAWRTLKDAADRKLIARGGFTEGRTWSGPVRADHPANLPDVHEGEGTLSQRLAKVAETHTLPQRHILEDPANAPADTLRHALPHFRLVGDEDTGVGLNCVDCDRGGLPVAYYDGSGTNPYRSTSDMVIALTINDLLAEAPRHLDEVHPGWAPTRCVNDTDGDGDCWACARNPQASCRRPVVETEWEARAGRNTPGMPIRSQDIPQKIIDILDRAAGREHSRTGTVAGTLAEILTAWERLRPPVAGAETAPATGPASTESAPDAPEVPQEAPNAPEASRQATDPYRWQWSATGAAPWTFSATEVGARRWAGPNGWIRRVSRTDGSPGAPTRAHPRQGGDATDGP